MMAPKLVVLLFFVTAAFEIGSIDAFRTDYTYVESTHSFYKFHQEDATWADAKSTCQSEGALLFHPENEREYKQVLSVLGVRNNNNMFLNAGFSDLAKFKEYETVDGRPISQVFNVWDIGQPEAGSTTDNRCGRIRADSFALVVTDCTSTRRYICKQSLSIENVVITAIEDVKTIIGNSSDRIGAALERIATSLDGQAAKQLAALERQAKSLEKLTSLEEENVAINVRSGQ